MPALCRIHRKAAPLRATGHPGGTRTDAFHPACYTAVRGPISLLAKPLVVAVERHEFGSVLRNLGPLDSDFRQLTIAHA